MNDKKSGKWFYLVGAIFIVAWVISRTAESTNQQRSSQTEIAPIFASPTPMIAAAPIPSPPQGFTDFSISASTPTRIPSPTPIPPPSPTPTPAPTPFPAATPIPIEESVPTYRVVGVPSGDYLNLREGPGMVYPVIYRIQNGVDGIKFLGKSFDNKGTLWQKMECRGVQGWAVLNYFESDGKSQSVVPKKIGE